MRNNHLIDWKKVHGYRDGLLVLERERERERESEQEQQHKATKRV